MNRGHLVGYLFSGLNDEPKNLIPITRYLNAGTISDKGVDKGNPNSMLSYEMKLSDWLTKNEGCFLDYYVVPNYTDSELLPRSISLFWTGYDKKDNQIYIDIEPGDSQIEGLISSVTLKNYSDNATINYLTGTANNLVSK